MAISASYTARLGHDGLAFAQRVRAGDGAFEPLARIRGWRVQRIALAVLGSPEDTASPDTQSITEPFMLICFKVWTENPEKLHKRQELRAIVEGVMRRVLLDTSAKVLKTVTDAPPFYVPLAANVGLYARLEQLLSEN